MILVILVAALALWWLVARMSAMETAIAALTARVIALEPPLPQPAQVPAPLQLPSPAPVPIRFREPFSTVAEPVEMASRNPDSLESRIGSRWLLYVGVLAIVVGVSYFEKLAFENQWIGETARVIQGAIAGAVLVGTGLRFVRRGYRLYGQVLCGCGIAILYLSSYAAFTLYHLVNRPAAFGLMSLVTIIAALLSDRQRSQSLALVAVAGGFATPFLLPSPVDAHIALFTYETILIAGTMILARKPDSPEGLSDRREWPVLNVVSYLFTVLTVAAWATAFYEPSKFLSVELFITAYCAMFLYILGQGRLSTHPLAALARMILWTAPFAHYVASLAILTPHSPALLAYLMILSFVGALASLRIASWIRLPFLIAVALPLLSWSGAYESRTWIPWGLTAWTVVYFINLAGLLEHSHERKTALEGTEIAVLHLSGLAAFLGTYALIYPRHAAAAAPVAFTFAAWQGLLATAFFERRRDLALHFAGLAFTLLTIAVGLQFHGPWLTSAWAAEGAAVIWLGLRERREWLRAGGVCLFGFALVRLIVELLSSHLTPYPLILLNPRGLCGVFVIALTYLLTAAHQRLGDPANRRLDIGIGLVAAKILVWALLTSEINAFWNSRSADSRFARELTLSLAWAVYATALIIAGLRKRSAPIRYFAITVFVMTVAKVFLVDLSRLDQIYRVVSAIGLGVMLLMSSYMYQRFRPESNP